MLPESQYSRKVLVVDGNSPLITSIAVQKMRELEMDVEQFNVDVYEGGTMNKMPAIFSALAANGIPTGFPRRKKRPKRTDPKHVQEQRLAEAEAKRERKRQKRLQQK